jgi:hypothetical protein
VDISHYEAATWYQQIDINTMPKSAQKGSMLRSKQKAAAKSPTQGSSNSRKPDSSKRHLLVILHGKRIHDDQIRDGINILQEEGHKVRCGRP